MAILHTAYNNLIGDPRLIHDKSFIMYIYDPLIDELPKFKYYMDYQCEDWTSHYGASSKTWKVLLKNLIKELFTSTERDNQDIPNVI